jgi:hypothetical protein
MPVVDEFILNGREILLVLVVLGIPRNRLLFLHMNCFFRIDDKMTQFLLKKRFYEKDFL